MTDTLGSAEFLELSPGLAAEMIDGRLRSAVRGRAMSNYVLAFYLHEMEESGKFRDLGFRSFSQYADQRLRLDPRRARELSRAGRALRTLTRIDGACREGRLCWTHAELLTHGVEEWEQDEWIARATRVSCLELKGMLQRHRKGLPVERGAEGGLPRAEFELQVTLSGSLHDKLEAVRDELMRRRGKIVDDSEVLAFVLAKHEVRRADPAADARRAALCEQDETPDWLRRKVIARDGGFCQACGVTENLHAHHIVFRSEGGPTAEANLVTVCFGCHGLIHEGRLFVRGVAPESVEFHDRKGEPLRVGVGASPPPRVILRVLQGAAPEDMEPRDSNGGQPPFFGADEVTAEWFVANMHRFEPGRDGVWRPVRSPRNRRRRSTAAG